MFKKIFLPEVVKTILFLNANTSYELQKKEQNTSAIHDKFRSRKSISQN